MEGEEMGWPFGARISSGAWNDVPSPAKIGSPPSRTPADEQDHDHGAGGHQQADHEDA
jgi:hypothetical protein